MMNFTVAHMREIMNLPEQIRNISIIGHVHHGKSTITDPLLKKVWIFSAQEGTHITDTREDEKQQGISIKSTAISMQFEYHLNEKMQMEKFLINLIDTPGLVDFSQEVASALRVTDGALVVVDFLEGVCMQTERVLRVAMQEKVKPVLMINKIDRGILECQKDSETIYQNFVKIIDQINIIIGTYKQVDMGDLLVHPELGQVSFGAGKDGWAFSCTKFAKLYAQKFNIKFSILQDKFWGENYFDSEANCWRKEKLSITGQRGFIAFIMEPICKLAEAVFKGNLEVQSNMLVTLNLKLTQKESKLYGKPLFRTIMSRWINLADTLLEMIVIHLPSPKMAQKYRAYYLYEGPQDDVMAKSMMECNPKGPLVMFVSNMIPTTDNKSFFAFGRVFSGTITSGQKVRIMGAKYKPGKKEDLFERNIERTVLMMAGRVEYIQDVPCGNIVGLVGVDEVLMKTGTITDHADCHSIRSIKQSVSPLVRIAVQPKKPEDLPKLLQALKQLSQSDPLVHSVGEETGQNIITGCSEFHVEICINDSISEIEIIKSKPIATYKETVTALSNKVCIANTPNKHSRIFAQAQPLNKDLTDAIENDKVQFDPDIRVFNQEYDWDLQDTRKIWAFGPDNTGANILVDKTKQVHYINEMRDFMESAWQWSTKEGALCGENLRGVRVDILDFMSHADAIHRGGGQIIPTARRLYWACELTAEPRLTEPVYLAEITFPPHVSTGVKNCLNQRRGMVIEERQIAEPFLQLIIAHLPVAESFGFSTQLMAETQGQAFSQCVFDHWTCLNENPMIVGSKAYELLLALRKDKGLQPVLPELKIFLDNPI